MSIKFNFNMCDNSPECSGLATCPTGAIYWDENGINALGTKGTLCVDNSKCILCGECVGEEGCPIGAILFSKTETDFGKDSDADIDQVKTLFVERYGAEAIAEELCISDLKILQSENNKVTVIEEFSDSSIQCLLHSIPIASILKRIQQLMDTDTTDVCYYKHFVKSVDGIDFPKLLIYKGSNLLAQINGYFDESQEETLYEEIAKQIKKNIAEKTRL